MHDPGTNSFYRSHSTQSGMKTERRIDTVKEDRTRTDLQIRRNSHAPCLTDRHLTDPVAQTD